MNRWSIFITLMIIIMADSCNSQDKGGCTDRFPAVAGQFYPSDSNQLKKTLEALFSEAIPSQRKDVLAIIAPHAGYVYSGKVAASAFLQADPEKTYKNIFIIGSSHRAYFDAAAVYADGNFITPLGSVIVDTALARKLTLESSVFRNYKDAHWYEHSLEVELPFLQYHLKKPFSIVPIVIGTDDASVCRNIAQVLAPYFNDENLFVISTDFSHYPSYSNAILSDKLTAEAIMTNNPDELLRVLKNNEKLKIPGLVTSLCGWSSVLTLLYITEKLKDIEIKTVDYQNSGDIQNGDTSRVVGYYAMSFNKKDNTDKAFLLSESDKKNLLKVARSTLESYISQGKTHVIDTTGFSDNIKQHCGAFVTLHKSGKLRGCIGQFSATQPLYEVVQQMSIASSTQDYRFPKVKSEELKEIDIEISVLSPMKLISDTSEIILGTHGIYIKKASKAGTFLPQVATETGWSLDEFLGHCASDKAGIGWEGWKGAEIYIYSAFVFGEKDE